MNTKLAAISLFLVGCSDAAVPPPSELARVWDADPAFNNECTWIQKEQMRCMGEDPESDDIAGFVDVPNDECLSGSTDHREALCMMEFSCDDLVQGVAWAGCHGKV